MNLFKFSHCQSARITWCLCQILRVHKKLILIKIGPPTPASCWKIIFIYCYLSIHRFSRMGQRKIITLKVNFSAKDMVWGKKLIYVWMGKAQNQERWTLIFSFPCSLFSSMWIYCTIVVLKGPDNIKRSEHIDNMKSSETLICCFTSALLRNSRT